MELRRYLGLLRRRWLLLVVTALVAASVAWTTTDRSIRYTATSTIYVGVRNFTAVGDGTNLRADTFIALDRIVYTFSLLLDSRVVASDALVRAGVDRSADSLAAATTATPIVGSQLVQVSVVDTDPNVARSLSIAVAEAFVDRVTQLEPPAQGDTGSEAVVLPSGLPVAVFERAQLPSAPMPIGLLNRLLVFAVFGTVMAAAAVFAIEYLDITIKGPDDAERILNVPVLASIPTLVGELSISGRVRSEVARAGAGGDPGHGDPSPRSA